MRICSFSIATILASVTWPYAAEQQYVYIYSVEQTGSWGAYVKNYAPNPSFDYGNRAAALWLDR